MTVQIVFSDTARSALVLAPVRTGKERSLSLPVTIFSLGSAEEANPFGPNAGLTLA
jgi:hypothetical protein